MNFNSNIELYNGQTMPLSNNPNLKNIQEKILKGEPLAVSERIIAGRDMPKKEIDGYTLKSDHVYRGVSEALYNKYKELGYIMGTDPEDEYIELGENGKASNNKGVDWYLGGVSLRYGNVIIECPADKRYFQPTRDNGSGMAYDPTVRHMKSSGYKNPVPTSLITKVIKVSLNQGQSITQVPMNNEQNLEHFLQIRDYERQRISQLRQQQLLNAVQQIPEEDSYGGPKL